MTKLCVKCGVQLHDQATFCSQCGTPQPVAAPQPPVSQPPVYQPQPAKPMLSADPVAITAVVLAAVLCLLSFLTMLIDSSTYINRLYTTACVWSLPLLTIVLIIYTFIKKKEGSNLLGWVAALMMVLSFLFSNTTKNFVQDAISNAENFIEVAAEAVVDNVDNVEEWKEIIEEAADDAQDKIRDSYDDDDYDRDYDW